MKTPGDVVALFNTDEKGKVTSYNSIHVGMRNVFKSLQLKYGTSTNIQRHVVGFGVVQYTVNGVVKVEARYQDIISEPTIV